MTPTRRAQNARRTRMEDADVRYRWHSAALACLARVEAADVPHTGYATLLAHHRRGQRRALRHMRRAMHAAMVPRHGRPALWPRVRAWLKGGV